MEILASAQLPFEPVRALLDEIDHLDCLTLPWRETFDSKHAVAMAHHGRLVACAWCWGEHELDVRVLPEMRRHGIGTALLGALSKRESPIWLVQPWVVHFDVAHRAAMEMAKSTHVQFEQVCRHFCWDGHQEDVPKAFQVAQIESVCPGVQLKCFLCKSKIPFIYNKLCSEENYIRMALIDGEEVGCLWAERIPNAWNVQILYVKPQSRCLGVGRSLLCDLMSYATREHLSVVIRLVEECASLDEREEATSTADWLSALGFWTYRTTIRGVYRLALRRC